MAAAVARRVGRNDAIVPDPLDAVLEQEGVGEETIPSKQETTQKRKRKPFEFGEWDSIEYFARV